MIKAHEFKEKEYVVLQQAVGLPWTSPSRGIAYWEPRLADEHNNGAQIIGERQERGERPVRRLWLEQTAAKKECGSGGSNMEKTESVGLETE